LVAPQTYYLDLCQVLLLLFFQEKKRSLRRRLKVLILKFWARLRGGRQFQSAASRGKAGKFTSTRFYKCGACGTLIESGPIKSGARHYHKQCLDNKKIRGDIREYYMKEICPSVVIQQLNAVVKNLIDSKGISPEFLLFALKYIKNKGLKINSPMGLHYYVNNPKIKEAFSKTLRESVDFSGVKVEEARRFTSKNAPPKLNSLLSGV
jgi:hypothetical protein